MKVNKTIKKEDLKNFIAGEQLNGWKIIKKDDDKIEMQRRY
jgi:hypothetical protein